MIKTIEQLKEQRPDLVELFESMSKEQLLNQIYLEVIDGLNMEERVQLFMDECTSLSKTNYSIETLKSLIEEGKKQEISLFCQFALDDIEDMNIEEIKEYLREEIIN